MSRRRRVLHWSDDNDDDDDDDEFPDLANLAPNRKGVPKEPTVKTELQTEEKPKSGEKTTTIRRRKLGQLSDSNSLLQAWTPEETKEKELKVSSQKKKREEVTASQGLQKESSVRKDRVELRTRKTTPTTVSPPKPRDEDADEEYVSAQEEVEVTIIEDVSLIDDTFHSCESEDSEFGDLGGGSSVEEEDQDDYDDYDDDNDDDVDDDSDEDFQEDTPPRRPSSKSKIKVEDKDESRDKKKIGKKPSSLGGKQLSIPQLNPPASKNNSKKSNKSIEKEIANNLSKLRLDAMEFFDTDNDDLDATPPSTPPKPTTTSQRSLASPTKLPRIPATPHHVSSDSFWSKEFVDDWNDQHSPAKTLFPSSSSSTTTTTKSKSKSTKPPSPTTTTTKTTKPKPASSSSSQTLSKKAFSTSKQSLAESFLSELDDAITAGQLSAMSASTGGIRLIWTNKLSTTAGRANWKRTRSSALTHHHASIELSTKIISDPNRLLNVIAHEFCHLANFMVSGITTNPHGKEFKAWAAKVTAEFGRSRGIEVTTKHSYEIDFKYVWECDECATEFKRHSKSIDPARHRCGVCKGVLKQTKPAPRMTAKSGNDGEGGKVQVKMSEYQVFMKEKMKRVKEERPGLKQNEVMKIVAGRWKEMKEKRGNGGQEMKDEAVKEVEKGMEVIDLT